MIKTIMNQIESIEFSVKLGIASSFRLFQKILYQQEEFNKFLPLLLESPENRWEVLKRIEELSKASIDTKYENEGDTALTVYLISLSLIDLDSAQTAAHLVLKAPNCWWADKFAYYLLQDSKKSDHLKTFSLEEQIKNLSQVNNSLMSGQNSDFMPDSQTQKKGRGKTIIKSHSVTINSTSNQYNQNSLPLIIK